jgi:hypothetical protein
VTDGNSAGGPSGPSGAAPGDDQPLHCRRLGHPVPFHYCRSGGGDLPCARILDCWFQTFDVAEYLRSRYTPEQIDRLLRPPRDKLSQILDIVGAIGRDRDEG